MKKIISTFFSLLTLFVPLFSFEWPQDNITKDSYNSYFGQNIGGKINTSLTFSEPSEIKAAEDGYVIAIFTDEEDESSFFPSTLGTAVILSHSDNLLSVYGNIDETTLTINDKDDEIIDSGAIIGSSGNSGFKTSKSNLEFQIIDTKNKSAINPKILMPRAETELPLILSGIKIQNKNNQFFNIDEVKTYSSGLYKIYYNRNKIASPYRTTVLINGVVFDQILYDTIIQENNKICLTGKRKYTSLDVYPNENLELIGETMFTPGRATLELVIADILGNTKHVSYNILIK